MALNRPVLAPLASWFRTSGCFQRLVSNARELSGPVRVLVSNGRKLLVSNPCLSFTFDNTMRGGVEGVDPEICFLAVALQSNVSYTISARPHKEEVLEIATHAHHCGYLKPRILEAAWKATNNPRARLLVGLKPCQKPCGIQDRTEVPPQHSTLATSAACPQHWPCQCC